VIATPTDGPDDESLEPQKSPPPSQHFELQKSGPDWTIPQQAIHQALEAANDLTSLQDLHAGLAALEKAAKDYDVAFEQLLAIAANRLRVERKIGQFLHQTLHRGRTRKASHDASIAGQTSSERLPKWFNWSKSSRYQRVAGVPPELFEEYLTDASANRKLPTRQGLLRAHGDQTTAKRSRNVKIQVVPKENLDRVWSVISATMEVSVAVGVEAKLVNATDNLPYADVKLSQLRGNVVVRADDRIEDLLMTLHAAKTRRHVSQVVVVIHATTRESWFRLLDQQGWTCCFVSGGTLAGATIVAYLGEQCASIGSALAALGAVMRGIQAQEESSATP